MLALTPSAGIRAGVGQWLWFWSPHVTPSLWRKSQPHRQGSDLACYILRHKALPVPPILAYRVSWNLKAAFLRCRTKLTWSPTGVNPRMPTHRPSKVTKTSLDCVSSFQPQWVAQLHKCHTQSAFVSLLSELLTEAAHWGKGCAQQPPKLWRQHYHWWENRPPAMFPSICLIWIHFSVSNLK